MTKTNTRNPILRVLCVVVGPALVGPAGEGRPEATCDVLYAEAFAGVDEFDAMFPVDPTHEA